MKDSSHDQNKNLPQFVDLPISGKEPARCVDGRPSTDIATGAQMPGGSLYPIFLVALTQGKEISEQTIQQTLHLLRQAGYGIGIHRGSQQSAVRGISDCGFADTLPKLLKTVISQPEDLRTRLRQLHTRYQATIDKETVSFWEGIDQAFPFLEAYAKVHTPIHGEQLIAMVERTGAAVEHTQGIHKESHAFINLQPETTLNVNELNNQGAQAFNMDLWFLPQIATVLNITPHMTIGTALILYQAAMIVLVEQAGKPAIPIIIR